MPIANGQILNRDNNRLLQGILDKQNVTFGQALQNSFQLTRDANNLQASQERDTIRVLDRDREFRENKFKDRRNFDRKVFTDDRAFGEGVRRFDIQDENADLSRDLQGELGRGRLGVARAGLALRREEHNAKQDLNKFNMDRFKRNDLERQEFLKESDSLASYEAFVERGGTDGTGFDTSESAYFDAVSEFDQRATARDFSKISDAQKPKITEGDAFDTTVGAFDAMSEARGITDPSVKAAKMFTIAESLATSNPAAATQAKLEGIEAQSQIPTGNKESVAAASDAYSAFQMLPKSEEEGLEIYRNFDVLIDKATTANSFEDFIKSLNTGGAADRKLKPLMEIYNGARKSTSEDLIRAQNADDQRGSIFSNLGSRYKRQ